MSIWEVTMKIEVDDDLLADHQGKDEAPPDDITDWYDGDVFTAYDKLIVAPVHDPVIRIRQLADDA